MVSKESSSSELKIPEVLDRLMVTEANIQGNISDLSLGRAREMLTLGNSHIQNGPYMNRREVVWEEGSQNQDDIKYRVSITPKIFTTYKNRDRYKNYEYR